MLTVTLLTALFTLAALSMGATAAKAQVPDPAPGFCPEELTPLICGNKTVRWKDAYVRENKCLRAHRWRYAAARIPVPYRTLALRQARQKLARSLSASFHRCRPTTPEGIIRYVFPSSTEDAAVRVAYCESRLWPYARNPSGASGLFQLMPGHWRGRFNPFDPWANTRYAYRLSDAGTNWGAWVCSP